MIIEGHKLISTTTALYLLSIIVELPPESGMRLWFWVAINVLMLVVFIREKPCKETL